MSWNPSSNPALAQAMRALAQAQQRLAAANARLSTAARANRWMDAAHIAGEVIAAEVEVRRLQQEVSRLANSNGPYRFDDADGFDEDGVDAAFGVPSPTMTLQRAMQMLARSQQAVASNDARMNQASRAQQWAQAGQAGIRAGNAERAVQHWQRVVQALSGGPYR